MTIVHPQHRYTGTLKAVILDWAGTVLDFGSRAPVIAVRNAFQQCEVPITLEQARAPMGKAKREHIEAILNVPEIAERWQAYYAQSPGKQAVEEVYQRFLPIQLEILADYCSLIPGCIEAIAFCRSQGLKIGTTTGYTRELMEVVAPLAHQQGYEPDTIVCASDVSPGRPAPWMCFEAARRLDVYPPAAIVKVDDTLVGIEAGKNAGMWTVGVVESGNLIGLTRAELDALDENERNALLQAATSQLHASGADCVIGTVAELPAALSKINDQLRFDE